MKRIKQNLENSVRELICKKYDIGKPIKIIAEEVDVKYRTVATVVKIYKEHGRMKSEVKNCGRKKLVTPLIQNYIRQLIEEDCSITLKSIQDRILEEKDVLLSVATLQRTINDFEYTFKKVVLIPEARNKEINIERRFDYAREIMTKNIDDLIFVDEMGVNCSMRQRYGRSLVGTNPRKTITSIRSQNISVCAGISRNAVLHFQIQERSFNTDGFHGYVVELLKTLQIMNMMNKIIIADNASIHRNKRIQEYIEQAGHQLIFLPPYTPHLNPIEELFSMWKSKIRSANCRTKPELLTCISNKHQEITAAHCLSFYSHMQSYLVKAMERIPF